MTTRPAGCGYSLELPDMDFECYSDAGYDFDDGAGRFRPLQQNKPGIKGVGAAVYSEHPSTEVLSLAYNLKAGAGPRLWLPGWPPPVDLFDHIAAGGLLEAWNSMFEFLIWSNVCTARMGWPPLPLEQLRDAMAKARAHGLPGALENAGKAIGAPLQKIADGKRLITKFCKPRTPTKKDRRLRNLPSDDPIDAANLYSYNVGDIAAEAAVSALVPDLSPFELDVWTADQRINTRGIGVDVQGLEDCKAIIQQALAVGVADIQRVTGGKISSPTEIEAIKDLMRARGLAVDSLDAEHLAAWLARGDLPPDIRQVLEVRDSLGAASVKKLGAMERTMCTDGRIRDLLMYCGAERTGRWAGRGVQPQNLPSGGPKVRKCSCGRHYGAKLDGCPWCGRDDHAFGSEAKWRLPAVEDALCAIQTRDLDTVQRCFGDAVAAVSGCLRGLLSAAPGYELISSDYSAIEAVVLAVLAGEEWRLEVFRTHGMIYEMSAAKITGTPFAEFERHLAETGEHHPLRKLGKTAELASGYQGWVGAWKAFGADKHFDDDDQIAEAVMRWREASPAICTFWHGTKEERREGVVGGLQGAATLALTYPGECFAFRGISYGVRGDALYCRLPSGRLLTYHQPRLLPDTHFGKPVQKITYMGWNADRKKGAYGWTRLDTYGGKLAENVTQATARDLLAYALLQLEAEGYPVVMHVHDEVISEVPAGYGSVDDYETIMCRRPAWAADWPVRASGGWRGRRYRKD